MKTIKFILIAILAMPSFLSYAEHHEVEESPEPDANYQIPYDENNVEYRFDDSKLDTSEEYDPNNPEEPIILDGYMDQK